jgi:hypothetical protein
MHARSSTIDSKPPATLVRRGANACTGHLVHLLLPVYRDRLLVGRETITRRRGSRPSIMLPGVRDAIQPGAWCSFASHACCLYVAAREGLVRP